MYMTPDFTHSAPLMLNPTFQLLLSLVMWVAIIMTYVGMAVTFEKAGEKWWKALIPLYSFWVEVQIAKAPTKWFWAYIGLMVASIAVLTLGLVAFFVSLILGDYLLGSAALLIAGFISLALFIPLIYFLSLITHRLSQAFGRGLGFTLGLLFLSPIFWLILAFDDNIQYQPKQDEPQMPQQAAQSRQNRVHIPQRSYEEQMFETEEPPAWQAPTQQATNQSAFGQRPATQAFPTPAQASPQAPNLEDTGRLSKGTVVL
jgi:hypothetical protein